MVTYFAVNAQYMLLYPEVSFTWLSFHYLFHSMNFSKLFKSFSALIELPAPLALAFLLALGSTLSLIFYWGSAFNSLSIILAAWSKG